MEANRRLRLYRGREAWQSEFWPPQAAEVALELITQLATKAAWLADDHVPDFANAVSKVRRRLTWHENRRSAAHLHADHKS